MNGISTGGGNTSRNLISIRGACQNNLRNLDVDFNTGTLTVITGPSGSGKSSLAFDTLYAEGQRRYVETFSPYARQFLDRCDRPKVDRIEGVPPAIAIDQNGSVRTSRSTVGTMTELNDHFKLLFAREARLFCSGCGKEVRVMSPGEMWEEIRVRAEAAGDPRLVITFDVRVPQNISRGEAVAALSVRGYTRIHAERDDGAVSVLSVVVDRFRASKTERSRGIEAVERALAAGHGREQGRFSVYVSMTGGGQDLWRFASGRVCADCGIAYHDPSPARFSFNSAVGACETCRGFGRIIGIDFGLVVPDEDKTLAQGCIRPWHGQGIGKYCRKEMLQYAARDGIRTDVPWRELTEEEKNWVREGQPGWTGDWEHQWYGIRHFFEYLETKSYKMHVRVMLSRYRSYEKCPACGGSRLKPESLLWRIGSMEAAREALNGNPRHGEYRRFVPPNMNERAELVDLMPGLSLQDVMQLPINRLAGFCTRLKEDITDEPGNLVISEILTRLGYLSDVGVGYLTLDRQSRTLSGGEVQRVNLTTALGTRLTDTLFVLDEPSIGLHPKDIDRVNAIMRSIRDAGNTLIVVEHDPQVMLAADRVIDMGPGAGENGGRIVYDGSAAGLRQSGSLTGRYLGGGLSVAGLQEHLHAPDFSRTLKLNDVTEHNLEHLSVEIPLNAIVTVTGVSGSGKSTLIADVLVPALMRKKGKATNAGAFASLYGDQFISGVSFVDQSPIGKTSRSNPVMYVNAFTPIRNLFASTAEAVRRGYGPSYFSFNSGQGRCPACRGAGFERIEMQFLSDVFLRCPDCNGKRYRPEILEVKICLPDGRMASISDVLDMTVSEAARTFSLIPEITRALRPLVSVGLGYVKLGQPASTLSGGEAQRLKLAGILSERKAASKSGTYGMLYVFDEPTTGLAFDDIAKLMHTLRNLVSAGNSVIVIEHNLDVIGASDWIIDLGPGGGEEGGRIVAEGTPSELEKNIESFTGRALAAYRKTFEEPGFSMQGLFGTSRRETPRHGRSMQEVWRQASRGDLGIFGARENNLMDVDVVIPKKRLSVITGVSGSGKSSLAFGVIFSEGQRRYLESINAFARSVVQPGAKADVEYIEGISPTVAIEQRTSRGGRKSTVSTLTEIQHYLRLLFVKLGVQHCPDCGIPVRAQSSESITAGIFRKFRDRTITVTSPLVIARKGVYTDLARNMAKKGIRSLRVDGRWASTSDFPKLARYSEHTIEMPVDTLTVEPASELRLSRAVQEALRESDGVIVILAGNYLPDEFRTGGEGEQAIYSTKYACPRCGRSFPELDPRLFSFNSKLGWCPRCFGTGRVIKGFDSRQTGEESMWSGMDGSICPSCSGLRLNPVARAVRFAGRSICELTALSVDDCLETMKNVRLDGREKKIGEDAIREIISRLEFLRQTGLGYIGLDRDAPSLSGGEAQRIRLASQLGSYLQGVCYVLDEPTIGLHPSDNRRLISCLKALRDKGNTVIVVEHDEETIRAADHIVDIGPGAGSQGGRLVVEGSISEVMAAGTSVTGAFLRNPTPHSGRARRPVDHGTPRLTVREASLHNLKSISPSFPLGRLIAITGVSGSGKSSLAREVLLPSLVAALEAGKGGSFLPVGCAGLEGAENIDRVLEVDQTPIGKTPRSCPATYVGFFNRIRDLYAALPQSKERGWAASRYSFNTAGGRCPVCEGQGQIKVEMNFLPDVKMTCEACGGMRFDEETLSVKWHGLSVGEVLNLPVDDALEFFSSSPRIAGPLRLLHDVGLGYLRLGQPSSTLSGGEAQRIKLVTELARADTSDLRRIQRMPRTFYILDEPTVGLHMSDTEKLVKVLHRLADAGNTVLVVEHNLDVIAEADYLIDLGPGGGPAGGGITAQGEPVAVAQAGTPTGKELAAFLTEHRRRS